ncbi:MAG: Glycosyl transferase family 2 [Candidatus Roizmanbacteria bacterium GW2011_GWB1_40_7]|uniref:Glycosyl transferase family 2 n=1 Tax=Candidatus Roizmanbacteria bacterium GW2011_GWB1_40_7 TaxID=1618482 RepID=A0A0G0TD85_9BACT|nr:MAG: Glycosyl transferase family 2 [Candidatus Roizmanbacteria bacterium GW2011_GWB1_40_7]
MIKPPFLSIVIPAYNEAHNMQNGVLDGVVSFLKTKNYTWEVILVDDGSTDDTKRLLQSFVRKHKYFKLIENPHQGKAGTVTTGMLKTQGTYILFTDFDQATPISELDEVLPFLKTHDIVIGSRAGRRKGAPLSRIIMARGFMLLRTLTLGIDVADTQCGFKAFRREVAHDLFDRLQLYRTNQTNEGSRVTAGFDVELLYLAKRRGYSIKEVPVAWRYVETRRVNPIRDSIEGLRDLLRIRLLALRGVYE